MPFFYRFRTVDALLGERQELEKQEIYFASPEELNDPMEGYKELFWQGDTIVWRNLLRHYLLCLMQTFSLASIAGKEYQPEMARDIVLWTRQLLPSDALRTMHEQICATFFSSHNLASLSDLLASRTHPVRREELEFYLRGIHPVALRAVISVFREKKLLPEANPSTSEPSPEFSEEKVIRHLFTALNALKSNPEEVDAESLRVVFSAGGHVNKQMTLIAYARATDEMARTWHSIFYSFPENYVRDIGRLVYPDWYAACFVGGPNHAAMWGNYGDGHKGVCLKFRAHDGVSKSSTLKMRGVNGARSDMKGTQRTYGDIVLPFEKMTYLEKIPEVDFFRFIGRITMGALKSEWYSDEQGNLSNCARHTEGDMNEWRQRYWAVSRSLATAKLADWRHEDEYRLVLMSALSSFNEPNDRKLVYTFSDLEGIIFGMKTSLDDKVRISDIIEKKCKESGRETFEFSEAGYNPQNGKLEVRRLDLLQFEKK